MALGLSYHRHRFDAASARRLLGMLGHLLAGFARLPEPKLGEIPLLGREEREQLLADGLGPVVAGLTDTTVLERFVAQTAATPEAVAVEAGEERLTYAALDAAADRLAAHLRALGVGRGEVVGICLERSLGLIVSLLATWKAGAAYLPLDPAYPTERRAFMVGDSGRGPWSRRRASRSAAPRRPPRPGSMPPMPPMSRMPLTFSTPRARREPRRE